MLRMVSGHAGQAAVEPMPAQPPLGAGDADVSVDVGLLYARLAEP